MKIGNWWLKRVDALENESMAFSLLANRTQSKNRAVGGKLFVTNKRILFLPQLFDALFGGKTMSVALNDITGVGKHEADGNAFSGGMRERLKIEIDGRDELFVVNRLDKLVEQISDHIAANSSQN